MPEPPLELAVSVPLLEFAVVFVDLGAVGFAVAVNFELEAVPASVAEVGSLGAAVAEEEAEVLVMLAPEHSQP